MNFPNGKYILNDKGEPVAEPDLIKWAQWMEANFYARQVGRETHGDKTVSTVFLALDHSFSLSGRAAPILWETAVITKGPHKNSRDVFDIVNRCSGNREQAEAMHARIVAQIFPHDRFSITDPNTPDTPDTPGDERKA